MRLVFYMKALQLLVAVCVGLLLFQPIDLCSEGALDKLLFDKSGACHHAAVFVMRTLQAPFVADNNTSVVNASDSVVRQSPPTSNDTGAQLINAAVGAGDQNMSEPRSRPPVRREPELTTKVCWTLGWQERFCRHPNEGCLGLMPLLVALIAVAVVVPTTLLQMAMTVRSLLPPTRQTEVLRSLLTALLWLAAATSMTVLCMEWADGWRRQRVQPVFPREWLVALLLGWSMVVESVLEVVCGDALHINVRFERITGRYDLLKNG
jgi:hypothetical protein